MGLVVVVAVEEERGRQYVLEVVGRRVGLTVQRSVPLWTVVELAEAVT